MLERQVEEETVSDSLYESVNLRGARPYLIVGDANAAIAFYIRAFNAKEIERHETPTGRVGHVKLQIGESIIELGEHPDAVGRAIEQLPRVGLRLYVGDVDGTYAQALAAGARGEGPYERPPGTRAAAVFDPFGLMWWLAAKIA